MESGQGVSHPHAGLGNFFLSLGDKVRVKANDMANHVHKGVENYQYPHHAEHVEKHVSQGRTPSLGAGRKGC